MSFSDRLVDAWYKPHLTALTVALWPLSLVFRAAVAIRRFAYRIGIFASAKMRTPVIVVGGIVAGGSGKTPLVRALASALSAAGLHPGLVARGYGGSHAAPRAVVRGDDPGIVGDESLLLAAEGLPVWIGAERAAAARALLVAHPECDLIIADDGLQHYALERDFEIAVIDEGRGLGNGCMLPAGPLREPRARLDAVEAIVRLVESDAAPARGGSDRDFAMCYEPLPWRNLVRADATADPEAWRGAVHAVAGIGDPRRFFSLLRNLGLDPVCHAFADHHRYTPDDLHFPAARAILMTEKDAVKCVSFADERFWYLPIRAVVDPALIERVTRAIRGQLAGTTHGREAP